MDTNTYSAHIDTLEKVKLFQGIERDELIPMLSCLHPTIKTFKKGEYAALMGHHFDGIGIVLEGELNISKENQAGHKIILSKLTKTNLFGEMIAFSNHDTWIVTVEALKDSIVMYIDPGVIVGNCQRLCRSHKLLTTNMLKIVSTKALNLKRKIDYLVIKSIRGKISQFLLEQYALKQNMTFMIRMNRNEMAEFLNVSRPSMSRELSKLKDEGVIDYYKNSFKIIDIEELKKYIEE